MIDRQQQKTCRVCGEEKPISEFSPMKSGRFGVRAFCRDCRPADKKTWRKDTSRAREFHLQKTHDLSLSEYSAMLETQGGKCAICGCTSAKFLCVDHCHKSGSVRRLLCSKCNSGIGMFRDDPSLLRKAAEYLEKFPVDVDLLPLYSSRVRRVIAARHEFPRR